MDPAFTLQGLISRIQEEAERDYGKEPDIDVQAHAVAYLNAGLSVFPIVTGGKKSPAIKRWKPRQAALPTIEQLYTEFPASQRRGIAVACGAVSGNLLLIDCDRMTMAYEWLSAVWAESPELFGKLTFVLSPRTGGGLHCYVRMSCEVPGNVVLAWQEDGEHPGIETRGQGGYVLLPGGNWGAHENNRPYVLLGGPGFDALGTITPSDLEILFSHARKLCRKPVQEQGKKAEKQVGDYTDDPYDYICPDIRTQLLEAGWTMVGKEADGKEYWRRPKKEQGSHSATLGYHRTNSGAPLLHVFSSSTGALQAGKVYGPFGLVAALKFQNNRNNAALAMKKLYEKRGGHSVMPDADTPPPNVVPQEQREDEPIFDNGKPCVAQWLDYPVLPGGCLVMWAGSGGSGKSSNVRSTMARLSRGQPAFGRSMVDPQGDDVIAEDCGPDGPVDFIYTATEEGWHEVALPHLMLEDADMTRIHYLQGIQKTDADGRKYIDPLALSHDFDKFIEFTKAKFQRRKFVLVVDPWSDYAANARFNLSDNNEQRMLLNRFGGMTAKGWTIWLIHHFAKAYAIAEMRVLGATAIKDKARLVIVFAVDKTDPENRRVILSVVKENVRGILATNWCSHLERPTPEKLDALRLEFQGKPDWEDEQVYTKNVARALRSAAVVAWDGQSEVSVDDVERAARKAPEPHQTLLEALLSHTEGITPPKFWDRHRTCQKVFADVAELEAWMRSKVPEHGRWEAAKTGGKGGRPSTGRFVPTPATTTPSEVHLYTDEQEEPADPAE